MYRSNRYPRSRAVGAFGQGADNGAQEPACAAPDNNCLCDGQPLSLAMAYVKTQPYGKLWDEDEAWENGTLFPALYFPYEGGR